LDPTARRLYHYRVNHHAGSRLTDDSPGTAARRQRKLHTDRFNFSFNADLLAVAHGLTADCQNSRSPGRK
jgi:hypothetical protein